jgi:hypothetical protein
MKPTISVKGATKHLFDCDGASPWVVATSVDEARKELANSDWAEIAASANIAQIPDDESFSLCFDNVPEGLTPDCNHAKDDLYGECVEDCGEDASTVTMTATKWANIGDKYRDRVFGEYA